MLVTLSTLLKGQSMIAHFHSLKYEPTIVKHNRRRRDGDPAFSLKSLSTEEGNITASVRFLVEQLAKLAARELVDVKWCVL